MQARELTQAEVAEGVVGINDKILTATQIQALVHTMDASKKRHTRLKGTPVYEETIKNENVTLYFNYPSLFQLHIEDKLDQTFFELLQLKRKMEKGEITPEIAHAHVGQTLFNRFVPHVISNGAPPVPPMSYEDFYKQSRRT
jgi:hypothetical protein